jgi:putative transposase
MAKFRDIKTLQKISAVHASIHNHLNLDRHLNQRDVFKRRQLAHSPSGVSPVPPDHGSALDQRDLCALI